jgi:hypothetical protein
VKVLEKPVKKLPKTGSTLESDLANANSSKKTKSEKLLKQRNATLVKLDLDPDEIDRAPQISSILKEANVSVDTAIQAMRFSGDSNVIEFMKSYDEASPTDRNILPLEAFAIMAEVNIKALLGAMVVELRDRSANIVKTILTAAHPQVTRASIRNAMKPGGVRDRQQVHTAMRLLPVSKGATVMVSAGGVTQVTESGVDGDDVDIEALFPNLEETQKMLGE